MDTTAAKALISGIVGILGAAYAAISGQVQLLFPMGLGLFFVTMLIQYGSLKFKVATSFAALAGVSYLLFGGGTAP